ncbi:transcription repressor NadR [[Eubacterium] tenue]|nr:transcription repressor NadR [[Eubacterium] tenue]MBC8630423.1 transcription repressor NadR [[Eubacterium] tenue]
MNAKDRRNKILDVLKNSTQAVNGSQLSKELGVSRQVIVSDIALIRASGIDIISTPKGYILNKNVDDRYIVKTIACKHSRDCTEDELNLIVDEGATVVNVIVEHSVYGQLTGYLHLSSRRDVREFMKSLNENSVNPLSQLTDGIHLHTIKCENEDILNSVLNNLKEKGYTL